MADESAFEHASIRNPLFAVPDFPMHEELRADIKSMLVNDLSLKVTPEEIADTTPLFGPDSLGLDSIDALQIAVSLEKNYGVKLANSEIARQALASVDSIHDFIVANRPA